MMERGPRIFLYPISSEEVTLNLAATLALFEPCLTEGVGDAFADLNREFLSAIVGIEMNARNDDAPEILESGWTGSDDSLGYGCGYRAHSSSNVEG